MIPLYFILATRRVSRMERWYGRIIDFRTYAIVTQLGWCRTLSSLIITFIISECTSTLQHKCASCGHSWIYLSKRTSTNLVNYTIRFTIDASNKNSSIAGECQLLRNYKIDVGTYIKINSEFTCILQLPIPF